MRITLFAACLSLAFGCLVSDAGAGTLRTVAFTGTTAPGSESGVHFESVFPPILNNSGQTAFFGSRTDTGVNGSKKIGIWREKGNGILTLVARTGSAAPDTESGTTFKKFDPFQLNDNEQTAFRGSLAGPGLDDSNDTGIWSEGAGSGLALVARAGNVAPDTESGTKFSGFFPFPRLNNNGSVAFKGRLTGPGVSRGNGIVGIDSSSGIWRESVNSGLALVARAGNAAPGTGSIYFDFFNPVMNDNDQIAFAGSTTDASGSFNGSGIWSEGAGHGLALVTRPGNAAPDTESGVTFGFFSFLELSNNGVIAFLNNVSGPSINGSNDTGIWSGKTENELTLVAREGNAAPGTENGVAFGNFLFLSETFLLNNRGHVAFIGSLTGSDVDASNNRGIWSERDGNELFLVARTGSSAPGTGIGVNFAALLPPMLNDGSRTAFIGFLSGTGVDSSNSLGIWAEDQSGSLQLIARAGDLIDVDDGPGIDNRTIATLRFVANSVIANGRLNAFNDLGQVAFEAIFTDGTEGVFVSNLVAIPEPNTLLLGALLGAGVLLRRRRQCSVSARN